MDDTEGDERPAAGPGAGEDRAPGPVREGSAEELLRRRTRRIGRIVSIRLAARLARTMAEALRPGSSLAARLEEAVPPAGGEPGLVLELARLLEREVLRGDPRDGSTFTARRALSFGEMEEARRMRREAMERLIDVHVAGLAQESYREVLVLRDYCGADWERIREHFELLSTDAAEELYRRAHEELARSLRSSLRAREGR